MCGAVAERLNFWCYFIYATILSGFGRLNDDYIIANYKYLKCLLFFLVGYPVVSRWGSNNIGWLKTMVFIFIAMLSQIWFRNWLIFLKGYYDYGGSGAVFLFAGSCAIVATYIIGPRAGRFDATRNNKGYSTPIPGHSITVTINQFLLTNQYQNCFPFS